MNIEIVVNREGDKPMLELIANEDEVIFTCALEEDVAAKLVEAGATEV